MMFLIRSDRFYLSLFLRTFVGMKKFDIDSLVLAVDEQGISADSLGVTRLAHAAHAQGIKPVLVDVLMDEAAPEPARVRALGRLAALVDTDEIAFVHEEPALRTLAHSA